MPLVVTPTIYESDEFIDKQKPTIVDRIELHEENSIRLFGTRIDLKTLYVSLLAIIIASSLWYHTTLLKIGVKVNFILILFVTLILNFVLQIFTSSTFAGSISLEQSRLISGEQMNSMLLGSLLVFIFIMKNREEKDLRYILMVILIISILNSLIVSVKKTGSSIRTIRKIKQAIFNITLILFSSVIYLYAI
jgi:hypothetical protein